ncbi:hypothetical protein [Streptomyces sp. NPDC050164]|uniref:hypothetical protein n=1 Tax=Streptomyces sp. NPDC050164 TaxID=3365605 RepID=UPI003789B5AF
MVLRDGPVGDLRQRPLKKKVGGKSAYTDGALRLNWDEDGKGVRTYGFKTGRSV